MIIRRCNGFLQVRVYEIIANNSFGRFGMFPHTKRVLVKENGPRVTEQRAPRELKLHCLIWFLV